jgi:hypothetical protein
MDAMDVILLQNPPPRLRLKSPATRGSCPLGGCRAVDRLLGCERVCKHAKQQCGHQDRGGEGEHSDGIHGEFPLVETIVDWCNLLTAR